MDWLVSSRLPLKVLISKSLNLLNEKKDVTFSLFSRLSRFLCDGVYGQ